MSEISKFVQEKKLKLFAFLYTNNEHLKTNIKNTI